MNIDFCTDDIVVVIAKIVVDVLTSKKVKDALVDAVKRAVNKASNN